MNAPRQVRPVVRQVAMLPEETPRGPHAEGPQRPAHSSSQQGGISPQGYEQCYRLHGAAQQMCLSRYY
jgi:hypothetical protein